MADYLRRKYSGAKIDAIIVIYPAALGILMQEEGKVFSLAIQTEHISNRRSIVDKPSPFC
jgi:hypothetical protein